MSSLELARDLLAIGALASITTGLWIERPSVALVALGALVLAGLVLRR